MGRAHKNSVFFLLAFSFALTVSKEKAVYDLDLITNHVDFKNIRENPRRGFSLIVRFSLKIIKFALLWLCVLCSHKFDSLVRLSSQVQHFFQKIIWRQKIKAFTRTIVDQRNNSVQLFLRHLIEISSSWEEKTN